MKKFKQTFDHVNATWTYKSDQTGNGRWQMLGKPPYAGDCEDYSLTIMRRYFGLWGALWALLTGEAKLHRIVSASGLHACGEIDGAWFDNWTKEPLPKTRFFDQTKHKYDRPYTRLEVFWNLLLGALGGHKQGRMVLLGTLFLALFVWVAVS